MSIRILASVAVCAVLAAGSFAASPAFARHALVFNKQTVINVCQRACQRGGSPARCCACVGGDWTGKYCM